MSMRFLRVAALPVSVWSRTHETKLRVFTAGASSVAHGGRPATGLHALWGGPGGVLPGPNGQAGSGQVYGLDIASQSPIGCDMYPAWGATGGGEG